MTSLAFSRIRERNSGHSKRREARSTGRLSGVHSILSIYAKGAGRLSGSLRAAPKPRHSTSHVSRPANVHVHCRLHVDRCRRPAAVVVAASAQRSAARPMGRGLRHGRSCRRADRGAPPHPRHLVDLRRQRDPDRRLRHHVERRAHVRRPGDPRRLRVRGLPHLDPGLRNPRFLRGAHRAGRSDHGDWRDLFAACRRRALAGAKRAPHFALAHHNLAGGPRLDASPAHTTRPFAGRDGPGAGRPACVRHVRVRPILHVRRIFIGKYYQGAHGPSIQAHFTAGSAHRRCEPPRVSPASRQDHRQVRRIAPTGCAASVRPRSDSRM